MTNYEQQPWPHEQEMIDLYDILKHRDFLAAIAIAEADVRTKDIADTLQPGYCEDICRKLNIFVGEDFVGMQAKLLAMTRTLDNDTITTSEDDDSVNLNQDMVYCGVGYYIHDTETRFGLRFFDSNNPAKHHISRFHEICSLEVANPHDNLHAAITSYVRAAQTRTSRTDFLEADINDQQATLKEISREIRQLIDACCDDGSELELSIAQECAASSSAKKDRALNTLTGRMVGVGYGEMANDPQTVFTQSDQFMIGHGAPCLVVATRDSQEIVWVPLFSLKNIEVIEQTT